MQTNKVYDIYTHEHLRKSIKHAFQFLLCKQRHLRNLSQYQLSRKCGLSRQYLSLIEAGKRVPAFEFIYCFAYGLDMNIEDFLHMLVEKVDYYENLAHKN